MKEHKPNEADEIISSLLADDELLFDWATELTKIYATKFVDETVGSDSEKEERLLRILGEGWKFFDDSEYGNLTVIYDPKPAIRNYIIQTLLTLKDFYGVEMLTKSFIRHLFSSSFKQSENYLENVYGIAEDRQQVLFAKTIKHLTKNNLIKLQDENNPMLKRNFPISLKRKRVSKIDKQLSDAYLIKKGGSDSKGITTDEQTVKLAQEYPSVLKHWQKLHDDCRKYDNWRDYAKPNIWRDTPDDLLDKLINTENTKISSLAIEHAARRSGILKEKDVPKSALILREKGIMATGYSTRSLFIFKTEGDKLLHLDK